MSRTDGSGPYWSWATWYEPDHETICPLYAARAWQRWARTHTCNLPEHPVRQRPIPWKIRRLTPMCQWAPTYPSCRENRKLTIGRHVPRWYVNHVWTEPERVRERDQLRNLAREYNAHGDLEDGDFPNWQHRRGATWYWD